MVSGLTVAEQMQKVNLPSALTSPGREHHGKSFRGTTPLSSGHSPAAEGEKSCGFGNRGPIINITDEEHGAKYSSKESLNIHGMSSVQNFLNNEDFSHSHLNFSKKPSGHYVD